jgi:micrococcal nuclease
MATRLLSTCFVLLVCPYSSFADFSGPVVSVIDGDTIDVLHNGQAERIRLKGIDSPEKGQAFGKKAKQFTSTLVYGKEVTIQVLRKDRHGRTVADVVLPDGTNVSRELVRAGLAWWYRQYSKDESLGALEEDARQAKRGLWADPNPIPPVGTPSPQAGPHSIGSWESVVGAEGESRHDPDADHRQSKFPRLPSP